MDEDKFRAGDVVRLKSGGPRMTVDYIDVNTGTPACAWFWKGEVLSDQPFSAKLLCPSAA
jgi:uncharacterized protein YodC (DUF2158 family)